MKLRLAAVAVLVLAGGCATLPPTAAAADDWPARRAALQALDDWTLDGRIAVAAGENGFSGGFDWAQQGERADVALSGPMGGAGTRDPRRGRRAHRERCAAKHYSGDDARRLIEERIGPGHALPVGEMRYWLVGVPAPDAAARGNARRRPAAREPRAVRLAGALRALRRRRTGLALPARIEMTTEGLRLRVVVSRLAAAAMSGDAWPAPAKLNLFLHVTGRRPDGYHEIQTVFQLIDLADEPALTRRARTARSAGLDGPAEVAAEDDLCVRAARRLQAACRPRPPGRRHPAGEAHPDPGRPRRGQLRCRDDARRPQ